MIYRILGIWLCFSLYSIAYAQDSFTIKGSVFDSNTLEPIEGATIIGTDLFSISSPTGEFIIRDVYQGIYTIEISHIGYTSSTLLVKVEPKMEVIKALLSKSSTGLDEVILTSKSKNRVARELPMATHLVTKDFLNKNRENSLMQTLKKIPGVSTINIGSEQSKPVIRGLGFNRVAVVQNGIKHEAQQWGNDHGLEIDQHGIENIRIIKGPASLLYGSDAIAGVVDIQPGDESKLVELADGTWMINSRVNRKGFRYTHTSTDEGKTWVTRPDTSLVDPGCNASIIRYTSLKEGHDKNRLLFSNANSKDRRTNMTIKVSYDEGKSWTEGKTIYTGSSAYSSMTILENGEFGLFFEKDNYQENVFVRLTLDWLTDGKDTFSPPIAE